MEMSFDGALVLPKNFLTDYVSEFKSLGVSANMIELADQMESVEVRGGVSKYVAESWGFNLYLSSTLTNQICAVTGGAAAIATIIAAAIPPAAPVAGIIAGLLALAVAALQFANASGQGVRIRYTVGFGLTGIFSQ